MKKFEKASIVSLEIEKTSKGGSNGNNDTNTHKGWCEMHKHPENGICTCGAGNGSDDTIDMMS